MQTIILKHVQVFVVITFEIFQIIIFWIERWVDGVNCIQTFLDFLIFLFLQGPLRRNEIFNTKNNELNSAAIFQFGMNCQCSPRPD